jgi:hypothetical protein
MTITAARVAEIIDAFGADAARWPVAERDAALTLIAQSPALQLARSAAVDIDSMLAVWAKQPVTSVRDAASAAELARRPRESWGRWIAGTALAATIAATVIATAALRPEAAVVTAHQTATVAPLAVSDEQAFGMLFTPTPEEEDAI